MTARNKLLMIGLAALLLAGRGTLAEDAAKAPGAAPVGAPPQAAGKAPGKAQPPDSGLEVIDPVRQYAHCIALARQKPDQGWEEALAWGSLGGGEPARQCGAIALIGLRQYEEAATRLEALARDSHGEPKLRAGMLAQAGQAWLLANQPERAYADQTAALKLVPDAPDILVDRSESLAMAKNYRDALTDLNRSLATSPNRVDALTFRATAKRFLNDDAGAAADAARAIALDPSARDAWLEAGILKRLKGDKAGARKDWMKVLELAPDSAAADAARRNLELMDVRE